MDCPAKLFSFVMFILSAALTPAPAQSGDYNLIRSDMLVFQQNVSTYPEPYCYQCDPENYIYGYRLEGFHRNDSSEVYHINRQITDTIDYAAWNGRGYLVSPSMLGDSIAEYENGMSYLYIGQDRQLAIPRYLETGESALCYTGPDSSFIILSVVECRMEEFLQLQDTVKTYQLAWYTSDSTVLNNGNCDREFKVSKQYGLISMLNFRALPDPYHCLPGKMNLIAGNQINESTLNFTYRDIYDFETGDEFEYRVYVYGDYDTGPESSWMHRIILETFNYPGSDSIRFLIGETRWGKELFYGGGDGWTDPRNWRPFYSYREYEKTYTDLDQFVLMPEIMPMEAIVSDQDFLFNIMMYNSPEEYNGRHVITRYGIAARWYDEQGDGGYYDWGSGHFTHYIVGCGHAQENWWQGDVGDEYCYGCEYLIYFKKGTEVWGSSRLDVEDKVVHAPGLRVTPNPASGLVEVSCPQRLHSVALLSMSGGIVRTKSTGSGKRYTIDVHGISPGYYIVAAETTDGTQLRTRLVITD